MLPRTTRGSSHLRLIAGVSATALLGLCGALLPHGDGSDAFAANAAKAAKADTPKPENISTETPIKHIIYIVGENRSFDNVFGTYKPKNNQKIWNLLSQGIVKEDGTPGQNFAKGQQYQMTASAGRFVLSPLNKSPYTFLPVPTISSAQPAGVGVEFGIVDSHGNPTAAFPEGDPSLPLKDQVTLATGGTGSIPKNGPDTRIPGVNRLPAGPFQQTGPTLAYDAYEGDTIHQLFQMWQQNDCSMKNATPENPTGCLHDLYPFVATTNGTLPTQTPTDGGQDMAFFNMNTGDAPIFKALADQYTISDNFHQAIMGGSVTGAIGIAYGDNAFYSDAKGRPAAPPANGIHNANPVIGSINTYQNNGTWVNCSDRNQPGVGEFHSYLASLPYFVGPNCAAHTYYPTRDADPPYDASGAVMPITSTTLPPVLQRHIGDALNDKNVSWAWYSGGYDSAIAVAGGATDIFNQVFRAGYCDHCNPFQYSKSVMADANARAAHLKDVSNNLFDDIDSGNLPAVTFVKPDGALQGHPGSGKVSLLEEFVQNVVDHTTANKQLFADTVIIVSFDESGGLYDSGFIQPLDFFGDGPRMPMLVISPYSTGGHVSHAYNDQVSVLKFIERNWHLDKISDRSRDNLPNPVMDQNNLWVPTNMPAIGDLFDMFDFTQAASQ